jgi:hypothetical protein
MRHMSKRQTSKKPMVQTAQPVPTQAKDYHRDPRESFHLPPELQAALLEYLANTKPSPGKSETLRTSLEEFLERKGYWPPRKP